MRSKLRVKRTVSGLRDNRLGLSNQKIKLNVDGEPLIWGNGKPHNPPAPLWMEPGGAFSHTG